MKLSLLAATSQINSRTARLLGTGTIKGVLQLADIMKQCGIDGDIYDLPNGSRNAGIASPFSLNNGFALTSDELDLFAIPELASNPGLKSHLQRLQQSYEDIFKNNRTVSYTLKRTVLPWVLESCFSLFKEHQTRERLDRFLQFRQLASYWLDHFAAYEVYKEQKIVLKDAAYQEWASPQAVSFRERFSERIEYHCYVQFLCYEQRTALHTELKKKGVGLFVNLPFGVEFDSADRFFHPEVFETGWQVGCSPEPEHGYPEQAWGVAVYREKSSALERYLKEKMKWLSGFGDGVFLDHLVGWCGQYVVPLEIPEEDRYPYGHFLTEDHQERKATLSWFLDIILGADLNIRGEVAGDRGRVRATRETIEEYKARGEDISAMAIPRWETEEHRCRPLSSYQRSTLVMVETHDTSTLLQYLLNQKGYNEDFEKPEQIQSFCNRVLALPFLQCDVPIALDDCSETFWLEICKRLCHGTPSHDLVFTLPGIISLLSSSYRSPSIENNINIKPGTSGAVGNGWRNWSYFSPPIEAMIEEQALKEGLETLGKRSYTPFDYFHNLPHPSQLNSNLEIRFARLGGRQIVYKNRAGRWDLLPLPEDLSAAIQAELLIGNLGEEELWERIDLSAVIDLNQAGDYCFQDLNGKRELYVYSAASLLEEKLFVRLAPRQVHHFLIARHPLPQAITVPD